jgi:hypothetical protein
MLIKKVVMENNDLGKISSRTSKKRLVEMSGAREFAIEKRIAAINLLREKRDVDPSGFFSKILKNKTEEPALKSSLILRLGPKLKTTRILENFLGKDNNIVDRNILQVLAYKGKANSVKKIDEYIKVNKPDQPTLEKALFAKTMISYREGSNQNLLPEVKTLDYENFRRIDAQAFERTKLSPAGAKKIITDLQDDHVVIPMATEKAYKIVCRQKSIGLFFNQDLVESNFKIKNNAVVASITEDDYCPGGHFIRYHVLANKKGNSSNYNIHVISPEGKIKMAGSAIENKDGFDFEVTSLRAPGSLPVILKASIQLKNSLFTIKEAKSGINIRKSSKITLASPDRY